MTSSNASTALSLGIIIGILGGLAGLAVLFVIVGKFCDCIKSLCRCCVKKKKLKKKKKKEKKNEGVKEEQNDPEQEAKKKTKPKVQPVVKPEPEQPEPEQPEPEQPKEDQKEYGPKSVAVIPVAAAVTQAPALPIVLKPGHDFLDSKKGQKFASYDLPLVSLPNGAAPPPPALDLYEYEIIGPADGSGHSGQFLNKSLHGPQKFHYKTKHVHDYVKDALHIV